ncbi:MAG: GNAT family N-acetyltransferase [Armatimonadetes bacterium]|nr:GNAT family N-acetyltransferase [Armatimonadota bacterium]
MEHRILSPHLAARENVIETYLELARAVPQSEIEWRSDYVVVRGPSSLSFCNFAARFEASHPVHGLAEEIADLSHHWPGFWIFVTDGDRPTDLSERLIQAGFMVRQTLSQMIWEPDGVEYEEFGQVMEGLVPRREMARFMADQFFVRTPQSIRAEIAEATARSTHRLISVRDEIGAFLGGVMMSRTPNSVGLYNLCVSPQFRHKGMGSSLVREVQTQATALGVPVVLQCHGPLIEWYETLGFRTVGQLRAFTWGTGWRDII